MPNKRSEEGELRIKIDVRLPRWKVKALDELEGTRTQHIEAAVTEYLKKIKK